MNARNSNISSGLDWCVSSLDVLREMPPDMAALCGLDMVLGWKAALENAITDECEDEPSD